MLDGPEDVADGEPHGWGPVIQGDEFDGPTLDTARWLVYDGAGHDGNGIRSPGQIEVRDGVLTIRGDSSGTTGGLALWPGQLYGRWEARMRVETGGDQGYHPVLLLWPDDNNWPGGGEIDYAEMSADGDEAQVNYLSGGETNTWVRSATPLDITTWHVYAVEWTASGVRAFIDGRLVFEDRDASRSPRKPMHQAIQLDWFPEINPEPAPSAMHVDWVRVRSRS
ncbi:glycoside hydrolase family 16 protein [Actinomycetospora lemnae]|uniref:Glycoside hydrolase family 16 protein n=1 Tax=Actinomycetospora lemnae TaxID=3019891 RepID=A0ABT5SVA7_9PSEU|nr:glycoside hydrolase family 16 protein [Actinomycetospora sp. DW7H6]MDD7966790.1 glycoside hydrolase family 16 protein [Actinomycetospora sp. DW7H6]